LFIAPAASSVDANIVAALAGPADVERAAPELPKADPPDANPPNANAPDVPANDNTPPQSDAPVAEPPQRENPRSDPPRKDPPRSDPPGRDVPKNDPPQNTQPKSDPPKNDAPKTPAGDQLTPDTLKRVKQATVYLRVTLPDGRIAQGSGFVAARPNVVVTNGHVVGMMSPEGRPPQKIEAVVNSGTPQEKTYTGKLAQVDARDDLAAIVLTGATDLPPPLSVGLAKDLFETQTVFVCGFPFGKQLGRNITVSKTSVSSVRTKAGGTIQDFVVNGGMHPGNSGGPVVDGNGVVVGVSVAVMKGTTINFAIAGETVRDFLNGRMDKRVFMAPYKEGDALKLPIRYHMTDPLGQIAKVVVETWTGKPGQPRPVTGPGGAAPLPDDSKHESYEFGYKNHKAEGEVALPVMSKDQALWVQLLLIRRNGSRTWHQAVAYPNKMAPVERKPVTLVYEHRPDQPCRLEMTQTMDFKKRGLDGVDKHLVTETKAQMIERLVGNPDGSGTMAGLVTFKKVEVKTVIDNQVKPDRDLDKSLKSIGALRALTAISKDGDLKPLKMDLGSVRDPVTMFDLAFIGKDLLQSLEAVTVPLPGKEVSHDRPWKVQRKLMIGSRSASQPALMDVDYILHGVRERNGQPDAAVIFLFGHVRGAAGAAMSAGGYMDGVATVDLKTNQVRFAEANLNLDLDLTIGKESVQLSGTLKITLVRTPLEGAERDQIARDGGLPPNFPGPGRPPGGAPPIGAPPGGPGPGGAPTGAPPAGPAGPVVGGKTRIQGGAFDPEFAESAPDGGLLVGFELGLQKFFNNDVVRAMRPIFRAGDKETLGTQRGTDLTRVVKVVAKEGYAVGAITAKSGLTVDGMSVTFMKITPTGGLDPGDAYESAWIGGMGGGQPVRLGNGTAVIGVIGKHNMRDMTGLGLLLRQ
jgi:hypothetical protein